MVGRIYSLLSALGAMSPNGPNAKCGNVRFLVAIRGKADVTRTWDFGSD
jgi:hypothetical protein